MSSSDEVKHQLTPEGKFTLWILLCELSVFVLFLVLGQPKVGLGVCICMAVFLTALRATWNLHGNSWYWGAVVIALVLQGPFIFNVPWSDHAFRGFVRCVGMYKADRKNHEKIIIENSR
jgi:cell division protein FtsW (lipid II flippase)